MLACETQECNTPAFGTADTLLNRTARCVQMCRKHSDQRRGRLISEDQHCGDLISIGTKMERLAVLTTKIGTRLIIYHKGARFV